MYVRTYESVIKGIPVKDLDLKDPVEKLLHKNTDLGPNKSCVLCYTIECLDRRYVLSRIKRGRSRRKNSKTKVGKIELSTSIKE